MATTKIRPVGRQHERFFALSIDLLGVAGFDGYFKQLNPAWEKTLGWTRTELTAKPFIEFVHPDERQATTAEIQRLQAGVESVSFETRVLCKDGAYKWTVWSAAGSTAERLFYFVARDITDRKRAEEALTEERRGVEEAFHQAKEEADRATRAKSGFLSRMSHELRTPLNAILGFAQVLETDSLSPQQHESIRHVLRAGRHLLDLINEVLDIAHIDEGRLAISLEPVSLRDVVQECLDMIAPLGAGAEVHLEGKAADVPDRYIMADRQRIKQVLLNLLSNAIKYNHKGGTVTLSYDDLPGGRLRTTVSDTGPGIPPERMDRLFTPFERLGAEQTGVEGSGLGLALSRRLVEAMGGTLGVDSTVGRGSTFWFEFPQADSPAARVEAPGRDAPAPAASGGSRHSRTVLYVEDNVPNLELIQRLLADRPEVRLLPAMQGQLGLDLAREHRPDLILLDLHLPDIPGDTVLRKLQEDSKTSGIPVVVISASAMTGQEDDLLAAGARAFLTKPLEIKQFLALFDEILSGETPAPTTS